MSYERNKSKVYSIEFKESSAKLAAESECSIAETARDLGIRPTTLYGWVSKYEGENKKTTKPSAGSAQELHSLRREIAKLKQQCEILKKAAAYFANEI